MHWPEPAHAQEVCHTPGVIAVCFGDTGRKRRANMARLHQHGLEALALHAADEPFRQRPRFEPEPNKFEPKRRKPIRERIRIAGDIGFENHGAITVDNA